MQAPWEAIHPVVSWIWRNTWQASVVVLLVLVVQWLLRHRLAPRWRHALWLLVVARLAWPISWETPVSLFNWVGGTPPLQMNAPIVAATPDPDPLEGDQATSPPAPATPAPRSLNWPVLLAWSWLAGVIALPSFLCASSWRLGRRVRRERPLIDAAVLNLLEDCKQEMGVRTPLSLVETPAVSSPSLFGFIRPRLLLPAGLTQRFSSQELRFIFLHELSHLKRGDILLNWLATVPLILHWFNPLVWFAIGRMRVDGELACDALALSHTRASESQSYGYTILKLVENFSRPALGPGMVGILENKQQMKRRITMIAKFKQSTRWPWVSAAVFTALALVTLSDAQSQSQSQRTQNAEAGKDGSKGPPRIVSTSPTVGQTEVDPTIKEITVTFDRDMAGGFSWTGSGPDYPPGDQAQKPHWVDKRTCALPVKLQAAHYYRVGINSTSYQNFRSQDGVPARPTAIYFATQGASEDVKRKCEKPAIVTMEPKNGATGVDPSVKELRVTFNVPMGGGFSWTGGGDDYPTTPEGRKPSWSADRKTCVLPVELKPGMTYHRGLNSPSHKNFQSAGGVPLDPVSYSFQTK